MFVYFHGFGSCAKPKSEKVIGLEKLGKVYLVEYDTTLSAEEIENTLNEQLIKIENVISYVGTSLGGYWAARMSERHKLPFVAINPAIKPNKTLCKYDTIKKENIDSYSEGFANSLKYKNGIILLDLADEVIPAKETFNYLKDIYVTHVFEGGNHRFQHINESLEIIKNFIEKRNF